MCFIHSIAVKRNKHQFVGIVFPLSLSLFVCRRLIDFLNHYTTRLQIEDGLKKIVFRKIAPISTLVCNVRTELIENFCPQEKRFSKTAVSFAECFFFLSSCAFGESAKSRVEHSSDVQRQRRHFANTAKK